MNLYTNHVTIDGIDYSEDISEEKRPELEALLSKNADTDKI